MDHQDIELNKRLVNVLKMITSNISMRIPKEMLGKPSSHTIRVHELTNKISEAFKSREAETKALIKENRVRNEV